MQKIYAFCVHTIEYLCAGLFTVLAIASFLKTASVKNAYEIVIRLTWDNPLVNISFLILSLGIFLFVGKLLEQKKYGAQTLLILTCIWVFCASMLWAYFSKSGPASDCGSVYYAAKQFAINDFSALAYRDSYFSVYPFQLGLALFYELIFRIAGSDNFHILQGVNALCLVMIVISQYHITGLFFQKKKARIYGLLLTAFCIPLIMYGSYIYGEIPSFGFILFGSWMILSFWKTGKIRYGLLAIPSLVLSVMVRKNSLIFLIALIILAILLFIKKQKDLSSQKKLLFISHFLITILLCLLILPLVQQNYGKRSGTEINSGIPASTYLAMGLMEADAGPGHYSGYNFDTFTVAADYDADLASEIGWADYRVQLSYFLSHPGYGLSFMVEKFLDQWLNAGWAIFDSIYVSFGERLPIVESCFSGSLYPVLISYMSGYQFLLYFFVAIGCLSLLPVFQRKKGIASPPDVPTYDACQTTEQFSCLEPCHLLFLLTAFGGFLVYVAWEASGRYILPYAIFVLPNAAYGAALCVTKFERLIHAWGRKSNATRG